MLWARLLAYVTGTVNQELLLGNEYLAAENRILRGRSKVGCCFRRKKDTGRDRSPPGSKGTGGRGAAAKPDTIVGWYRKLLANNLMDRNSVEV